jgi:hypothetical protein
MFRDEEWKPMNGTVQYFCRCVRNALPALVLLSVLPGCGWHVDEEPGLPQTMTLTAEVVTPSEVSLQWTAHTDAVAGYDLYRNSVAVYDTHLPGTSYTDNDLQPNTRYCYVVYAVVAVVGRVAQSNQACVNTPTTAGWNIETVATGTDPALALDSSNIPHLSFRNTGGVRLAVKSGLTWQQEVVDAGAGNFGDTDVQLDDNGADHVSYWDYATNTLKVASNATGPWVSRLLDSGGNVNALALDKAGASHISYSIQDLGSLNYASDVTGSWLTQWLAGFGVGTFYDTDILVTDAGVVHLVYTVGSGQACVLYYMSNSGASWTEQIIAQDSNCGVALAENSSGELHVAYTTPFGLWHAHRTGGVWVTEQVDEFSWIGGERVALAIDEADFLHIAYRDQNADLKYATDISGSWALIYIDSGGQVGYAPAIAVDPLGAVSIAYEDRDAGTVKLANN